MNVLAMAVSHNKKTGPVSATYVSQATCPPSCAFRGAGCYAEHTGPVKRVGTDRVNAGGETDPTLIALEEAAAIDRLPGTRPLRLHIVGDCPTNESAQIVSAAARRYTAKHGHPVWAYTHGWQEVDRSSWDGVSIIASCETAIGVLHANTRGYAAALVYGKGWKLGHRAFSVEDITTVIPCPEQHHDKHPRCVDCRLCFDDTKLLQRGQTIGFSFH